MSDSCGWSRALVVDIITKHAHIYPPKMNACVAVPEQRANAWDNGDSPCRKRSFSLLEDMKARVNVTEGLHTCWLL